MTQDKLHKSPSTKTRIRFQDCDPFGHLNNARYLDYFINAREDHLLSFYGLDIYERQRRRGTNWVIAKTKIAYLHPAVFREEIRIRTRLLSYSQTAILMEGQMTGLDEKELKAVVWIEFRHFDLSSKKPARHSKSILALFDKMVWPASVQEEFDARVRRIFRRSLHDTLKTHRRHPPAHQHRYQPPEPEHGQGLGRCQQQNFTEEGWASDETSSRLDYFHPCRSDGKEPRG